MQLINRIQHSVNRKALAIKMFFIVFYAIGVAGILVPPTFPLFIKLIPFALLLSGSILALFHGAFTKKELILFGFIFISGFLAEVAGVNTGAVFGHYQYGNSLGIKIFNTPLIIGFNWVLLVYLTASIMEEFNIHPAGKVLIASLLMLGYDIVLEQIAPELDMWYWRNGVVPFQNYVWWFVLALIFHIIVQVFRADMKNTAGPFLFLCQAVFFVLLFIFI